MQFKVILIFLVCIGYVAPFVTHKFEKKAELLKAALEKKKIIINAIQNSTEIKESLAEKKKMIASIVKDVAEFKGKLLTKAISLGGTAAMSAIEIKKKIIEAKLQSKKPESHSKPCDDKDKTTTAKPSAGHGSNCNKDKSIDVYEVQRNGIIIEAPVAYRLLPPAFYGVHTIEYN